MPSTVAAEEADCSAPTPGGDRAGRGANLADAEAYQRDRRKGSLSSRTDVVLRFLDEDMASTRSGSDHPAALSIVATREHGEVSRRLVLVWVS